MPSQAVVRAGILLAKVCAEKLACSPASAWLRCRLEHGLGR